MAPLLASSGEPVSLKILGPYTHLPGHRDELLRVLDLLTRLFSEDNFWLARLVQVVGCTAHFD